MRRVYMSLYVVVAVFLFCGVAKADPAGWGPTQIRAMYKLTEEGSAATTIVMVTAYNQGSLESKLTTYRSQYGLPSCTTSNGCLHIVPQDNGSLPSTVVGSWTTNGDIQAQMASAGCPSCKLTIVVANTDSDANLRIATVKAKSLGLVVHAGFGIAETSGEVSAIQNAFDGTVALVAPTGEGNGALQFPASMPGAFGISRTTVSADNSARGYSETLNGGRSGFSAVFAKQTYEPSLGSSYHSVTFGAVCGTDVAVYTGGSWQTMTNTLIASSLYAGFLAALEGSVIVPDDAVNVALFDILSGSDATSHSANTGRNLADGFDAPDFTAFQ